MTVLLPRPCGRRARPPTHRGLTRPRSGRAVSCAAVAIGLLALAPAVLVLLGLAPSVAAGPLPLPLPISTSESLLEQFGYAPE